MIYKIIGLFLLILISINFSSANVFINGDFESGSLTGWDYDYANISNNSYHGNYSAVLYPDTFPPYTESYIYQLVDLTNIDYIEFYVSSKGNEMLEVHVDTILELQIMSYENEGWIHHKIDVSRYTGQVYVDFITEDLQIDSLIYIDSINSNACSAYNYRICNFDKVNATSVYWANSVLVITLLIVMTLVTSISAILNILNYMRKRDL